MATAPPPPPLRARRPALIPYHEDLSLALAAAAKFASPMPSPVTDDEDGTRADLGDWINSPDSDSAGYYFHTHRPQSPRSPSHEQPITQFPAVGGLRINTTTATAMATMTAATAARFGIESVPASPTSRTSPDEVESQIRRVKAAGRC
ncbi:hypothetical protein EX30DRAFT_375739 [Ascodesmis nigricans]|uniref:Uncharacterized protein n=1 Tax=Ascodesmis nigricans TaxID=341454 RepID=A0A4S2MNU4_9PEZI|nr:hypothetical protein EX30DRAFT_375739 [Ascodesmis nigricans]